jgi:mRNA interferase MazF
VCSKAAWPGDPPVHAVTYLPPLNTTIAAVITSNTSLAAMPGNVFVPAAVSGLPKDSVVNITALVTLNQTDLEEPTGQLPESLMEDVNRGLRRVLGL